MAYSEGKRSTGSNSGDKKKHPFSKFSTKKSSEKRSFGGKKSGESGYRGKSESDGERKFSKGGAKPRFKKPFKKDEGDKKPFRKFERDGEKKSFEKKDGDRPFKRSFDKDRKKSSDSKDSDRPFKRSYSKDGDHKKSYGKKDDDRPKRSYSRDGDHKKSHEKKEGDRPFKRTYSKDGEYKKSTDSYRDKKEDDRPFKRSSNKDTGYKKSYEKKEGDRPFKRSYSKDGDDKKSYGRKEGSERSFKRDDDRKQSSDKHDDRKKKYETEESDPLSDKYETKRKGHYKKPREYDEKPKFHKEKEGSFDKRKDGDHYRPFKKEFSGEKKYGRDEALRSRKKHKEKPEKEFDGLTRLNKYLSNAGICSRREADDLIRAGAVSVNGKIITEMGYKIKADDVVNYGGETLRREKKVYLLLNKPKDYITTTDDPQERNTVMDLIEDACRERIYPVGRLDRNTLGLLLFTNDGEIATKLMHPKNDIRKIYHVSLDKNMKAEDFEKLEAGLELEDGFIKADEVSYVGEGKREIGIEIHSGKNRIVRRMFEHLGYEVIKLDRVSYAGLTKKDLPRGKWRFLSPKEVGFLKMLG